jgi:inner membrane protein
VLLLDLTWSAIGSSTPGSEFALVDEPAHLASALVLLLGLSAVLGTNFSVAFVIGVVVASVMIDIDHLPDYFDWDGLREGVPRPYPHSLATVAGLLAAAWLARGWGRSVLLGAAFGVGAHLVRDLATGPGVALLWPASSATVEAPYVLFAAALALATAAAFAPRSQQTL